MSKKILKLISKVLLCTTLVSSNLNVNMVYGMESILTNQHLLINQQQFNDFINKMERQMIRDDADFLSLNIYLYDFEHALHECSDGKLSTEKLGLDCYLQLNFKNEYEKLKEKSDGKSINPLALSIAAVRRGMYYPGLDPSKIKCKDDLNDKSKRGRIFGDKLFYYPENKYRPCIDLLKDFERPIVPNTCALYSALDKYLHERQLSGWSNEFSMMSHNYAKKVTRCPICAVLANRLKFIENFKLWRSSTNHPADRNELEKIWIQNTDLKILLGKELKRVTPDCSADDLKKFFKTIIGYSTIFRNGEDEIVSRMFVTLAHTVNVLNKCENNQGLDYHVVYPDCQFNIENITELPEERLQQIESSLPQTEDDQNVKETQPLNVIQSHFNNSPEDYGINNDDSNISLSNDDKVKELNLGKIGTWGKSLKHVFDDVDVQKMGNKLETYVYGITRENIRYMGNNLLNEDNKLNKPNKSNKLSELKLKSLNLNWYGALELFGDNKRKEFLGLKAPAYYTGVGKQHKHHIAKLKDGCLSLKDGTIFLRDELFGSKRIVVAINNLRPIKEGALTKYKANVKFFVTNHYKDWTLLKINNKDSLTFTV